ncbi:hypothetical protein LTR93_011567 [Exophiala xenobiotica]|nr:hypothetical protein LTR93_011567 [Exophiala xenobiotica]
MPFTVAIAGITGRFGRCLLPELLKKPDISIRGFARSIAKAPLPFRNSPRIQLIEGDSGDIDSLRTFVRGVDIVVCAYAGDDQFMVEG